MKIDVAHGSHRGRVRENNQDSVGVFLTGGSLLHRVRLPLFVVADGMGGHVGGEVASRMAVDTIRKVFYRECWSRPPGAALKIAIQQANDAIRAKSAATPELKGMGTTVVAATVVGDEVSVANVGDSRCYIIRGEDIRQITQDHSVVAERMRAAEAGDDQPAPARGRNVLTRSVGRRETLEVDVFKGNWQPGDTLLLCSDGLWGQVSDAQIAVVVSEMTPEQAAAKLIDMAMIAQAPDNISVIIVRRTE